MTEPVPFRCPNIAQFLLLFNLFRQQSDFTTETYWKVMIIDSLGIFAVPGLFCCFTWTFLQMDKQ